MSRLSRLILIFSIAYTLLIFAPAILHAPFPPMPLMEVGDATDLLTPLILLPLYWLLLQWGGARPPRARENFLFVALSALWAMGQGMHLSANSIGHLLDDLKSTDAYALTHFYDEVLSHYLWHLGIAGMAILLIWHQWHAPFRGERSSLLSAMIAAVIHGFTYFTTVIEAGTAPLGIPVAIAVTLFGLLKGRTQLHEQPLLAFFFVSYALGLVLILAWGVYWRGLPQFSELGIIK